MSKVLRQRAMEDGLTHLYHAGAFKGLVERKLAKMKAFVRKAVDCCIE